MRRERVWIDDEHFSGWGCSQCGWQFRPEGSPVGNSLEDMKRNYRELRDKEFAAHVCAEHPRPKDPNQ